MRKIQNSLSKTDVYDFFKKAELFRKKNVDNIIVLMIFKFAFYCGLKTGDILQLKLRDVCDEKGSARSSMVLGGRAIIIPADLKTSLVEYLRHLHAKHYPTNKTGWLFPAKKASSGQDRSLAARKRKLHRDVREVSGINNAHEKIRQAGIREFFDHLPSSSDREGRIREAAEFACCSDKWVEIVLASRKQEETRKIETGLGDRKLLELRRRLSELEKLQIPPDELKKLVLDIMDQVEETTPELLSRDHLALKAKKLLVSRGIKLDV